MLRVDGDAREIVLAGADFAGERIDLANGIDLSAPHFHAIGVVFVGGINLDHVAANAEGAAAEIFAALVLDVDEAAEQMLRVKSAAFFEHDEHAVIGFGRADAVDAGDGGDDDDVATLEERASGAHAELVELIVDGGFFFDVESAEGT